MGGALGMGASKGVWFPRRKGESKGVSLWRDILQTSCQRGCPPLDSLLTSAGGHPLEPLAKRLRLSARSVRRQE